MGLFGKDEPENRHRARQAVLLHRVRQRDVLVLPQD
jgi:hypothetical protein